MAPAPTHATARAQVLEYLISTLRSLPAELALSLRHPDLPHAALHHGVTLPSDPCDPDEAFGCLDIRYWVLGTTPDAADHYTDLVLQAWEALGWEPRNDRDAHPRSAYARTPDGYALTLTQSVNGYLSVAGTTPPFARDSAAEAPFPSRLVSGRGAGSPWPAT